MALTAAHVFDLRPEAASLLNLAALCPRCHNRHDAKDRPQGRRDRDRANQGRLFLPIGMSSFAAVAFQVRSGEMLIASPECM